MLHTPTTSNAYLQLINTLSNVKFINSSYGNDCCDCIWNEERGIRIFFPNVLDYYADRQQEEYTTFSLVFEGDEGQHYLNNQFDSVGELISLLNALDRELTMDSEPVKMQDFLLANCDYYESILVPVLALEVDGYYKTYGGASGTTEIIRIK